MMTRTDTNTLTQRNALQAKASAAYCKESRCTMEDKWIVDLIPLVRHAVSKIAGSLLVAEDREDLVSAGTLGLIKAVRAFDPSMNANIKTYAYIRIHGAIIDEIRKQTFVPANTYNEMQSIKKTYQQLMSENQRPPTDDELAKAINMPVSKMYKVFQAARQQHFLSIHGVNEEESIFGWLSPKDKGPSPQEQAEKNELCRKLAQTIQKLPERERRIIILYYEQDLTMKEIAKVLEVTESRISQIHAAALFKLEMMFR